MGVPVVQDGAGTRAAGAIEVALEERVQLGSILSACDTAQTNKLLIGVGRHAVVVIIDVGHATRHPCAEVAARLAEHHHHPARHVLASMIAHPLDHRPRTGVADGEALAGAACRIQFAASRTIERRIAQDHVVVPGVLRVRGRPNDNLAAA